ncbi:MAG: Glu-tRNA(Gln) amidotransferase subunit GatD [Candidatus Nanoarchaeia archaeon]|nr:Glu-tRNA(Gln) amidotransferase subunit GatD [Candidatus Nanoarchaeia archaeon]
MKSCDTSDSVQIKTDKETISGVLMPSQSDNIVIKLDNGYNIGIDKKKVKEIKLIKKLEKKEKVLGKLESNKQLKNVLILHTGGTVASKVDYKTGGVSSKFEPEEIIAMFPELKNIVNIKSKLLFNIFSEDMNFSHYKKIAHEIFENVTKFDGIILAHGTDTLHYTASALAFMLENLHIPVILVGAQRSSDRGSSDAFLNLLCASHFIANTDFAGVAICMHKSSSDDSCVILNPCKTRKLHTSRRDAFKPVNSELIAKITRNGEISELEKLHEKKDKLILKDKLEEKVGIIKYYPNISSKQFDSFKGYKGLIIEGTGLGHTTNDKKIIDSIKNLIKTGTIVVMTSQCIFGGVNMNVYSTGRELQKIGVIQGLDMLSETAYIKLSWLLGNYKKNEIKDLLLKNLRGEINERILYNEKFLDFK